MFTHQRTQLMVACEDMSRSGLGVHVLMNPEQLLPQELVQLGSLIPVQAAQTKQVLLSHTKDCPMLNLLGSLVSEP